jgi:hypothetical protein
MDAAGLNAGLLLQLGDDRPQRVAANGLPCSALACSTNWPPLSLVAGVAIDTLQPNS